MAEGALTQHRIGWIGTGRMGIPMVTRLLAAGADVSVWNRTRSKAEPLAEHGATVVDDIQDLADCDIVFTMVTGPDDFIQVTLGEKGVLSKDGVKPKLLVDCTTISEDASRQVRAAAADMGVAMLDAPVSGNNKMVEAGLLSIVASGDAAAFDMAKPYLEALGQSVTYVGAGEASRIVKICHNVFLGVMTQSLAELLVLAEKHGVPRRAFMEFINGSSVGSRFSTYKTDAFVKLDYTPTFTAPLLRKDLDLGLAAGREKEVPMPVAALTRELVQNTIGHGHTENDFAVMLDVEAANAGIKLKPQE